VNSELGLFWLLLPLAAGAVSNGRVPIASPASFCWIASIRARAPSSWRSQCAFSAWPSV